jgi:hypothetical protein
MIAFTAALATILVAAAPTLSHQVTVDHAGTSYQLRYEPQLTTSAKTIGAHAGARPSTQRCRWTVAVQVERQIGQPGKAHALSHILPTTRQFSGDLPGSCVGRATAIDAAQASKADAIRAHVAAVAGADRQTVLAEIDSARSLALN